MNDAAHYAISVEVAPRFLDDQSTPEDGRYAFAYTIRIHNQGRVAARLVARLQAGPRHTYAEIKRLLGTEEGTKIGTDFGLGNDWAYNIIKQVGNYGESFERNVGKGSPLQIERGLNALWIDGGLIYGLPIR